MINFGFSEVFVVLMGLAGLGFWVLLLWLAWTLVMSVRGIHHEIARLADQLLRR
jgi:hypothetical protein